MQAAEAATHSLQAVGDEVQQQTALQLAALERQHQEELLQLQVMTQRRSHRLGSCHLTALPGKRCPIFSVPCAGSCDHHELQARSMVITAAQCRDAGQSGDGAGHAGEQSRGAADREQRPAAAARQGAAGASASGDAVEPCRAESLQGSLSHPGCMVLSIAIPALVPPPYSHS